MCTAIILKGENCCFGRNLDLEYRYNETVTITPRRFPLKYREAEECDKGYALIGMAYVKNNYPLYYDAMNEKGLGMAGLNFPYNAHYNNPISDKINIASFDLIPYILSECSSVAEAKKKLSSINITNVSFSEDLPSSPLHWIIADKMSSVTVESLKDGLHVYDNPYGVLTNNPPFDKQKLNYSKYLHLSAEEDEHIVVDEYFSRGKGALGLPGDWSSMSRFVKAVFMTKNAVSNREETAEVGELFHILATLAMPKGCVRMGSGNDITQYSSCACLNSGKYYYTTYQNRRISCVNMNKESLDGNKLICYPLLNEESVFYQN